jgi:PAS domain-containing protein
MTDELTTTMTDQPPEGLADAGAGDVDAGAGQDLDPQASWQALLASGGELPPAAEPVAEPVAEPAAPPEPTALEQAEAAAQALAAQLGQAPEPIAPVAQPPAPAVAPAATAPEPPAADLYALTDEEREYLDINPEAATIFDKKLQEAITKGRIIPAEAVQQRFTQFEQQMQQVQAELAGERWMNQLSDLSGMNARALDKDAGFKSFLEAKPAFQAVIQHGSAEQVATVLKAYGESQRAAQVAAIDAGKAEALARKQSLYKAGPAAKGGSPSATRELPQEEFNRLPRQEQERLWKAEADKLQ